MRWKACRAILMLPVIGFVSGCVTTSGEALCDATASLRDAHVEALLADGGDRSVQTGVALVGALDAVCG